MKHNIIKTENYLLVVDDSEIKVGDLILYKNSSIAKCLGFPTDGGGGLKIQIQGDIAKIKTDFESCKKIIAHLPLNNSPILEGVPLLPPFEDEVERLTWIEKDQIAEKCLNEFLKHEPETSPLYDISSKLLRQLIIEGIDAGLNSLSQPKTPIAFECEIEKQFEYRKTTNNNITGFTSLPYPTNEVKPRTTTDSQGQTQLVGRYIFN